MFCTARNFSPPWARKAAFARSFGEVSAVIEIAGAAAAFDVVAPFAGAGFAGSWAKLVPLNTTIASEARTVFLITKTFRREVKAYLRVDAAIACAGAARSSTAAKAATETQRLTETRRR